MPSSSPRNAATTASRDGRGELGEPGGVAGVTTSTPPVVTAPFTWSWASCDLREACWAASALAWLAWAGSEVFRALIC